MINSRKILSTILLTVCALIVASCSVEDKAKNVGSTECTTGPSGTSDAKPANQCLSATPEFVTRIDEGMSLAYTNPELARKAATELFVIFEEANDGLGQAKSRQIMAASYEPGEEWETARELYLEALTYINEADNVEFTVSLLQKVSDTYVGGGLYEQGYEYLAKAIEVSGRYDYKPGKAQSDYLIGVIMLKIHDYEGALDFTNWALESEALPADAEASSYRTLANTYRQFGQPEKSLALFEQSLAADPNQTPYQIAITHYNHAQALIDLERLDEAEILATKALELSRTNGYAEYLCLSTHELGRIALARGDTNSALDLLDMRNCDIKNMSEEYRISTDVIVLPDLIKAMLSIGQYDDAVGAFEHLMESQKRLFGASRANAFGVREAQLVEAGLQGRVEFLEQQDELNTVKLQRRGLIALLAALTSVVVLIGAGFAYRSYQTQKRANGVLINQERISTYKAETAEKSLGHKTLLIHEINHRVKNNLQIIISLLNTQRRSLGSATTDAASDILVDVCGRVETMAIVQQSLNETEQVDSVQSEPFISDLVSRLIMSSGRDISVDQDIEDARLSGEVAAPLALIINELVSNTMKHAFKGGAPGKLHIALQQIDTDQFELTYQDNGSGLPAGFNLDSLDSFGLSIVQMLAEQISGQLTYESVNPGTKWIVTFKTKPVV